MFLSMPQGWKDDYLLEKPRKERIKCVILQNTTNNAHQKSFEIKNIEKKLLKKSFEIKRALR